MYNSNKKEKSNTYVSESSWRDQEDLHASAPFARLEFDRKTMRSDSGKRPPDEAHGHGKEAIFCAAPHSKI